MPLLLLTALFVGVPLIEIALFIQVGGMIGLWPTLLVVLVTGFAGAFLLREQGLGLARDIDRDMREGRMPAESLLSALFIGIAGCLLLTPGFFTDAIGFLLFIPAFRKLAARGLISILKDRIIVETGYGQTDHGSAGPRSPGSGRSTGPIIDGEAVEIHDRSDSADDRQRGNDNSPWRSNS